MTKSAIGPSIAVFLTLAMIPAWGAEGPRPTPFSEWKSIEGEATYARNFERRTRRESEKFPQIVTVYDLPMSDDRRVGRRISAGEYLQIFKVGDPASTIVQVRLDRGSHWILSRQTFRLDRFPGLVGADPEADAATWNRFRFALQDEIDTTRHTLAKAVK